MRPQKKRTLLTQSSLLITSFLLVAFGQPSWLVWFGPISAVCGFALFWKGAGESARFFKAALWYAGVQLFQLSWMTSIEYQGYYILFVYLFLAAVLGIQFGILTLFIPKKEPISLFRMLMIASFWTLMEWIRYQPLCGFSFNLVGLSLSCTVPALQMASLFGALGLSFWVMLTNLAVYNLILDFSMKRACRCASLALFPYLFGALHLFYHTRPSQEIRVALVQTGLLPSEKMMMGGRLQDFVSPWEQWRRLLSFLKQKKESRFDLIVFPEAALPFFAQEPLYSLEDAVRLLKKELGDFTLPPLVSPFAEKRDIAGKEVWLVSNLFWAQALASHFQAEVIVGLDDRDRGASKNYNAAFHLLPTPFSVQRYAKRVLLPLAEYLPFEWCRPLVAPYGISEFFSHGSESPVVRGKLPLSLSICYEETFPHLMREGRLEGGALFVNLTNDNYYPFSRLPEQHFDHARLRTVENGVPLLRACNTGVTAAVDSLGRVVGRMGERDADGALLAGVITVTLPLYDYKTLYTYWGNSLLLIFCFGSIGLYFLFKITRSDKFLKN